MPGISVEAGQFMSDTIPEVKEQEVLPNVDGKAIFKKAIEEKRIQDKTIDAEIRARMEGPRGKLELGELFSGRSVRWLVDKIKGIFYAPTSKEIH